ncbi:hypothetical protein THIX_90112 [Thiomonas sp. X19]|nr:hypothetical protein THIX_90112 [Thiomonas sp. X19]
MTAQVQRPRGKPDLSALDSKRLSPGTVRRRKRVCQSCLWSTARVGEAGQFSMAVSIGSEAGCTAAASPPRRARPPHRRTPAAAVLTLGVEEIRPAPVISKAQCTTACRAWMRDSSPERALIAARHILLIVDHRTMSTPLIVVGPKGQSSSPLRRASAICAADARLPPPAWRPENNHHNLHIRITALY